MQCTGSCVCAQLFCCIANLLCGLEIRMVLFALMGAEVYGVVSGRE